MCVSLFPAVDHTQLVEEDSLLSIILSLHCLCNDCRSDLSLSILGVASYAIQFSIVMVWWGFAFYASNFSHIGKGCICVMGSVLT